MDSRPSTPCSAAAFIVVSRRAQLDRLVSGVTENLAVLGPDRFTGFGGVDLRVDLRVNVLTVEEDDDESGTDDDEPLDGRVRPRIFVVRMPVSLLETLPEDGSDDLGTVQLVQDAIITSLVQYRRNA